MSAWEPVVGDVVSVNQADSELNGDVGEVTVVLPHAVGVRIVQEESRWRGQLVYFNAGQLAHVEIRKKEGKRHADNR